jgi:mitogen-activated protein kinase 1/3
MDTNLERVLQKSEEDLSEEHWRFFLYQILRGLKYMHSSGVVHGNLVRVNFYLEYQGLFGKRSL